MDTHIGMAESFCCPPETIATLLIGYTSIQNNKMFNNKNRSFHSTLKKKKRNWQIEDLLGLYNQPDNVGDEREGGIKDDTQIMNCRIR